MVRKVKTAWNWENDSEHMNFKERFKNLDHKKICKTLGVAHDHVFKPQDDPIIKINIVLFQYCDQAFGPKQPSLLEKRAVIQKLAMHANALKDVISKTGERSLQMLDYCLSEANSETSKGVSSNGKGQMHDEVDEPHGNVGFWKIYDGIESFSEQLNDALATIPEHDKSPKKGRKPNIPLRDAIYGLAGIFEEFVDQPAYAKFSIDEHGIASNSFMCFLDETLIAFDPLLANNKVALGATVRRILSS